MDKIILLIGGMVSLLLLTFYITVNTSINKTFAELYKDYDGKLITEEQMMNRYNICIKMISDGKLKNNIDCSTFIFTEYGVQEIVKETYLQSLIEVEKRFLELADEIYNNYSIPSGNKNK